MHRSFVKRFLEFMKKHGDVQDNENADRMLAEVEREDAKSEKMADEGGKDDVATAPSAPKLAGQVVPPAVTGTRSSTGKGIDEDSIVGRKVS